jgi:hypothetical protein
MHRTFIFLGIALLVSGCVSVAVATKRADEAELTGICCVHNVRMNRENIKILYGLTAVPMGAAFEAQVAKFPFAHRQIYGGCVFMEIVVAGEDLSSPTFAEIYVCSKCDSAKARWILWHPWDSWAKTWKAQAPNKAPEPTTMAVTPRAIEENSK